MYYKGIYEDHARAMREVDKLRREVRKALSGYSEPGKRRQRKLDRISELMQQIDYWKHQAESLEQGML